MDAEGKIKLRHFFTIYGSFLLNIQIDFSLKNFSIINRNFENSKNLIYLSSKMKKICPVSRTDYGIFVLWVGHMRKV